MKNNSPPHKDLGNLPNFKSEKIHDIIEENEFSNNNFKFSEEAKAESSPIKDMSTCKSNQNHESIDQSIKHKRKKD